MYQQKKQETAPPTQNSVEILKHQETIDQIFHDFPLLEKFSGRAIITENIRALIEKYGQEEVRSFIATLSDFDRLLFNKSFYTDEEWDATGTFSKPIKVAQRVEEILRNQDKCEEFIDQEGKKHLTRREVRIHISVLRLKQPKGELRKELEKRLLKITNLKRYLSLPQLRIS